MGEKITRVDRSAWNAEQLSRAALFDVELSDYRKTKAAREAHVFAGLADGLDEPAQRATNEDRYSFIVTDFKNGHLEAVAMKVVPHPQRALDRALDRDCGALPTVRGDGDREASMQSATRRAKRDVRHRCKSIQATALWTLTFKQNVTDLRVALRVFERFTRLVRKWLPGWVYLAVEEQQSRGAYHFHLATHSLPRTFTSNGTKIKSWDLMRRMWRQAAGDLGGNFDEAKRKRRFGQGYKKVATSACAIASYIAGYVAKEMAASELNRKRFHCSKGIERPLSVRQAWAASDVSMLELIELCYAAVGDRITRSWFDAERGVFFLESDDTGNPSLVGTG